MDVGWWGVGGGLVFEWGCGVSVCVGGAGKGVCGGWRCVCACVQDGGVCVFGGGSLTLIPILRSECVVSSVRVKAFVEVCVSVGDDRHTSH